MKSSSASSVNMLFRAFLLSLLCVPLTGIQAADFSGRFSMLGSTARAEQGDIGYIDETNDTLTADQQSLRLMLEAMQNNSEWSLHAKTLRIHLSAYPLSQYHTSELFRYRDLANNWLDTSDSDSSTRSGYEIDRASYKQRFDKFTLSLGRQPIDWGSGRFWQPLNIFGAFSPTDLDTDFKPGIDAAMLDWFPGAFSALTAVYVFAPEDNADIDNSSALHYRRQVGETSEIALLAGSVTANEVIGVSFESDWHGMGWRIEAAYYDFEESPQTAHFWIAGIDYQFGDGTLLAAEWYNNTNGASNEAELIDTQADIFEEYGLQQHMGDHVLGVLLDRNITPLLQASYTLLIGFLNNSDNSMSTSNLQQLNLVYSVSDESDLLVSLLHANGKGLNTSHEVQSEFGHTPTSLTLRLRFYF